MDLTTPIWSLIAEFLAGPFVVVGTLVIGFSVAVSVVATLIQILDSSKE